MSKIREYIRNQFSRLSSWFSHEGRKSVLTFLFFLLLSFIFWLMLFFQRSDVDGSYKIPVKYKNIPNDRVFEEDLPQNIEVTLSDKGSQIFKFDIKRIDSLEIDVSEIISNDNPVLQGEKYSQMIRSKLPQSSNLRGYFPMIISFKNSRLQSKEVPIVFDGEITTARANLIIDNIHFIPETITVYGSSDNIKKVDSVRTQHTLFKNIRTTSQLPVKIEEIDNIRLSQDEVDIYIPILEFTERMFEVPIKSINVPQGMDVKFFPSRVEINFSVTLEQYKTISPDDFEIAMDYNKFKNNENGKVTLTLTKKPSFIKNDEIWTNPSEVEFLIEKN